MRKEEKDGELIKPEELGLNRDLGFTKSQIRDLLKGLDSLMSIVEPETPISEIIAELKNHQSYYASLRSKADEEKTRLAQEREHLRRQVDVKNTARRRNLLKAGIASLIGSLATIEFGDDALNLVGSLGNTFSNIGKTDPEAERRAKLEYEANNTLGLTFSSPSTRGWRIAYPKYDPKITYVVEQTDDHPRLDSSRPYYILLPTRGFFGSTETSTDVYYESYFRSDGVFVPKYTVKIERKGSYYYEPWILNDKTTSLIDNSAVIFWNEKENERRYIGMISLRTPKGAFDLKFMRPEQIK